MNRHSSLFAQFTPTRRFLLFYILFGSCAMLFNTIVRVWAH
jgi:hypothetical protein